MEYGQQKQLAKISDPTTEGAPKHVMGMSGL